MSIAEVPREQLDRHEAWNPHAFRQHTITDSTTARAFRWWTVSSTGDENRRPELNYDFKITLGNAVPGAEVKVDLRPRT